MNRSDEYSGMIAETIGVLGYSAALHLGNAMWWLLVGRTIFGIGRKRCTNAVSKPLLFAASTSLLWQATIITDSGGRFR